MAPVSVRNAAAPEGHRIVMRIGIHLGDIILDGTDIYGAQAAARRLMELNPGFWIGAYVRLGRFPPELNQTYAAALCEAGLPE